LLRFSNTSSKDIDLEALRTALLNHILSKQTNKELLIKVDDEDKKTLELLTLFGIDYSRVVSKSENIKYHTGMAMKLLLDKKAFNCFCSDEALELDKEKAKKDGVPYSYSGFCETISDETKFHCNAPFVVRIKKPMHTINFTDLLKGELSFEPHEVDSFVILDHKKLPTESFATAVDDMLFDTSTIIQDESELYNIPKQIHVRESLGYDKKIEYIHLPEILEENLKSVQALVDEGYLPSAIANYIIHLNYTPPKEIFTIEEAIEWFDIKQLSKTPAQFDLGKLNSINREHMKLLDDMRFSKIVGFADEDIGKLAKLYIEECDTIQAIKEKINGTFGKKIVPKEFESEFQTLKDCLEKAPFIKEFDELKSYITQKTGLKSEKLLKPLGFVLTGTTNNQKLERIYPLIRNYLGEII
jgi:glutamyl-tRNA synthetase